MDISEELIEQVAKNCSILPARARGNCRIWFVWKGAPVFTTAGTRSAREAREVLRDRLREWFRKQKAIEEAAAVAPATPHPWRVEAARFVRLEHKHSKDGYRGGVEYVLNTFGAAAGWPDVSAMTKDRFRDVWDLVEAGKAAHTQANWLGILGSFARFLENEIDGYPRDFTRGVKRPPRSKFGKRETIYQDEWFRLIWNELPLWVRPIWEDHWFTGLDSKDLWEFQPHRHMVNVGDAWKIWKVRAKETEIVDQPLSSKIRPRWIEAWKTCGPEGYLHPEARKRYADEKSWGNQVRNAVHAAQKKLGLPLLDIKSTRHTFATRHLLRLIRQEKNAPTVDQIRRWMGHAPDSRVLERLYFKLLSLPHLMD